MTNKNNTVLYTGNTNDLKRRIHEHKSKINKGFTSMYNINKLVYFEEQTTLQDANIREKQIKSGSRIKKIKLIESINPKWEDLSKEIME